MRFRLEYEGGIFVGTTSGEAVDSVFAQLLDDMLSDQRWKPGTPWLHDHRKLDAGPLTVGGVQRIAQFCAERREALGAGKAAIVVSRDLEFGLARMWAVYVEGRWDVTAELFRSREEGIEWLKSDGPASE